MNECTPFGSPAGNRLRHGVTGGDQTTAPRCGSWSRRTGLPCRVAAMANGRCRMHGGTSTGHGRRRVSRVAPPRRQSTTGPRPVPGERKGWRVAGRHLGSMGRGRQICGLRRGCGGRHGRCLRGSKPWFWTKVHDISAALATFASSEALLPNARRKQHRP
jgi:hypothetical protein